MGEAARHRQIELKEEKQFLEEELEKVDEEGKESVKEKEKEIDAAKEELRQTIHRLHYDAMENEVMMGNSPPSKGRALSVVLR